MHAVERLHLWPTRRLARHLARMLLGIGLLLPFWMLPASADRANGSGNWIDWTSWCGGGACVPTSANHESDVEIEYYHDGLYYRVVYWQNFGGMVRPYPHPLCGSIDWIKSSTYYETADGNVTIGGWFSTGALCGSDWHCHNYRSETDYYLTCSLCRGGFHSFTWFTSRCIPNRGATRATWVAF